MYGMYGQLLSEGSEYNLSLSFSHLYGDKWACFLGKVSQIQPLRRIIFPDFMPKEGETYSVRVKVTKTGIFNYQGEEFRVCRAELAESATRGEVLIHKLSGRGPLTVMGAALRDAGIGTSTNTTMADKLRAAGIGKRT